MNYLSLDDLLLPNDETSDQVLMGDRQKGQFTRVSYLMNVSRFDDVRSSMNHALNGTDAHTRSFEHWHTHNYDAYLASYPLVFSKSNCFVKESNSMQLLTE